MEAPKRSVFISYRHKSDMDTARLIYEKLRGLGYPVFMDKEGLGAVRYDRELFDRIYRCDVFVVILSKDTLKPGHDGENWVVREIAYALQCERRVIPLMKDGYKLPKKLPAQIARLRKCQWIPINYDFFGAVVEKLDTFIARAQIDPRPDPQPPYPVEKQRTNLLPVLAGLAALILVVAWLLKGCPIDPEPTEPSDAPSQTSQTQETESLPEPTEPEPTEPEPTEPEIHGNSVTNLCNGAFVEEAEDVVRYISNDGLKWYNVFREDDTWYYYNADGRYIHTDWKENGETIEDKLLENVDCAYLHVTSQWLYYVKVEGGEGTLWRAKNDLENHTIGKSELIAEKLLYENSVALYDGWFYYWVIDQGLYRCRTDGSDKEYLYPDDQKNTSGWVTFGIDGENLYFWHATSGLFAVRTDGSGAKRVLDVSETGNTITHAVERGGIMYFVEKYMKDDGSGMASRIRMCDTDGAGAKTLVEDIPQEVRGLNVSSAKLYMQIADQDGLHLYGVLLSGGDPVKVDDYT